jgi:hypothetical protein
MKSVLNSPAFSAVGDSDARTYLGLDRRGVVHGRLWTHSATLTHAAIRAGAGFHAASATADSAFAFAFTLEAGKGAPHAVGCSREVRGAQLDLG